MLITLFVVLSAGIIAGSILFYRGQRDIMTINQTRELLSIAELKARQISDYRKERYSEANFLFGNQSFIAAVKAYHSNPQLKVNKDVLEDWLLPIQKNHNYENISIIDTNGNIFYSIGNDNSVDYKHRKDAFNILKENKIRFGDLHLHEKDSSVHLEVFVPLILTTSISVEKVGVVSFSINPHTGLFDLIQSWPVESPTGEVLLVKKEGDHVVFQNELRFMRNTALRLKFPLTDTRLPAAHAVQGETGVMTGLDYRGHEVMAAMKHVPDSDWYIVAKKDTERINQPLTTKATLIFALMAALLAAAGTAFFIVWRAEKMKKLKIEIQSVDAVKRLNRVYQVLSNVNQAIVRISDRDKLLNEICRIAGDDGGFRLCWVGFVNEKTGLIEPFSKAGAASSYLKYITVSTNGSIPAGQGPVGKAFQTGKPVVFNNIWTQFQLAPWKENAIKYRLRSVAALPLNGSSGPIGAIGFYSDQFNFFTTDEVKLLEELSADLSYALLNIEREERSKISEQALLESEDRYRDLVENSLDIICTHDMNGKILSVNKRGAQLLDYAQDDLLQKNLRDILVPEIRKEFDVYLSEIKQHGSARGTMLVETASGKKREWEYYNTLRKDGVSSPIVRGTAQDITERKRAETALRESENIFKKLFEESTDPILLLDDTGFIDFNNSAVSILGYNSKEELFNKKPWELSPEKQPDGRLSSEKAVAMIEMALSNGFNRFEWVHIKSDGTEFPVEVMLTSIMIKGKQSYYTVWRDISERKRAESALVLQSSALNAAASGIVITNSGGVIEWVNKAFSSLTGYSPDEAVGKNPRDLVKSGSHDHAFYKHMWDTILDGKVWNGEITNRRKDGTLYIEEQIITPVKNEQGKITHFIAVKQDVTERKKGEEALRKSNERFVLISRATNDAVWDWDITTDKTWWNDRFYSLFGFTYDKEHTSLKSWAAKIHPDDRERVLEHFRNALNGISQGWADEFRYQFADGSYGFIYDRAFIIRDDSGKALRMIGSMIDMTNFKKSEQQLQQSENRLRAIVEAEPECVKTMASDGTILSMNAAGLRMIGAESADQVVGKPIYGLIAPEYAEAFKKLMQRVFEGRTGSLQFRLTGLTGANRWLDTHAVPLRDEKGNITTLLGVTRDITEQKKALEALRENEAKLKVILESTADGILAIDTKGAVIMANPRFFELWRIPYAIQKSGADQVLLDFVLEQLTDPEAFLSKVKMLYDSNDTSLDTLNFKDGRVFERLSAPLLSGTTSLGRLWSFRDISERKRSMEALLASEEKYKSFFDDDLTGDFISTPDGKLLACNPAFAKMFGYDTVDEALKMDVHSLYSDKKARENMIVRLKREKRLEYFTSELIRKDGKKIYVIENMIGTFNKKGELTEIKGYLFDDTRRRSLETQLIQAQKMESLGTLAGGIAHDFNNILAIIMGHTSMIRRKSGSDEHLIQNAETITKATQRGASLVKQLLTFARKTDAVLESILIQDTVNEIRRFIEQTFPKTVTITTEFEKDLPPILADGTQIHQVLLNLTINARDAMPHGGALSITAHRITKTPRHDKFGKVSASEYIHVKVSDTGTGMDEETKNRIFEPFFTTKGRERGTGLGLATVYGIVESHHGIIDVESEIGKGSTFNLFFPIQQSFIQHEIDNGIVEEISGGDETVLVVDDEESMRYFLESILAEKGYHILSAADGQAALDMFTKHNKEIDLILTDLGLPKMNGEELVTGIIKTNPNVKIIVASGFFENKLKATLAKAGVKEFVQKPYSPDEILKKVREVLDLK